MAPQATAGVVKTGWTTTREFWRPASPLLRWHIPKASTDAAGTEAAAPVHLPERTLT